MYPMTTDEQLRTIFIGHVPRTLSDQTLEAILRVFPGLQMFTRVPGAAGISIQSESTRNFVSTCERNTRAWIAKNASSVSLESVARQSREQLVQVVQEHVNTALSIEQASATAKLPQHALQTDPADPTDVRAAPQYKEESMDDLTSEQQKIVREEVEIFRKFTVIYEKQKSERVQRDAQERQKRLDSAAAQVLESRPRGNTENSTLSGQATDHQDLEDHFYPERDSESESETKEQDSQDDDWALEQKYKAARMKDLQARFVERERRWRQREKAREAAVIREQAKSSNKEVQIEANKAKIMKHLDEFNDDSESTRRAYEYFYDHHAWAKKRLAARAQELSVDRQSEHDEALEEGRKQQQQEQLQRQQQEQQEQEQQQPLQQKDKEPVSTLGSKIRLVFSGPGASKSDGPGFDQAVLLDTKEPSISTLPRMPQAPQAQDVYAQTIDVSKLKDDTVLGRLRSYLESQIIDLLGIQEDDLINFIIEHVRAGKTPQSLEAELEQTLDEDAADFTASLWTSLAEICSSESD